MILLTFFNYYFLNKVFASSCLFGAVTLSFAELGQQNNVVTCSSSLMFSVQKF